MFFFFFQAEDGIRDVAVTGVQTLLFRSEWSVRRPPEPVPGGALPLARHLPLGAPLRAARHGRSEEHTSELQSRLHLVCRLLLEKKKKYVMIAATSISIFSISRLTSQYCS